MDNTSIESRQEAWDKRYLEDVDIKKDHSYHRCVHCGVDTKFGSGSYVDRIPADRILECDTLLEGYLCGTCQSPPTCEECGGEAEYLDSRCESCNSESKKEVLMNPIFFINHITRGEEPLDILENICKESHGEHITGLLSRLDHEDMGEHTRILSRLSLHNKEKGIGVWKNRLDAILNVKMGIDTIRELSTLNEVLEDRDGADEIRSNLNSVCIETLDGLLFLSLSLATRTDQAHISMGKVEDIPKYRDWFFSKLKEQEIELLDIIEEMMSSSHLLTPVAYEAQWLLDRLHSPALETNACVSALLRLLLTITVEDI